MDEVVKVNLISDAAKTLETRGIICPHRDHYKIQPGAVRYPMAVAGDQCGKAVKFPGHCLCVWVELPADLTTGDDTGKVDILVHGVPDEIGPRFCRRLVYRP